ncbi:segregation/condensation protein A [Fonticella tunisiensis]|uniref:Segregation and condensation protein A n=1 Tax=Fonticella tunisiensis TaxID=1096341 RepID=A0A4R7KSV5_9CLOT|nr:segregation/condensation protein A [Fonticella tunisiensis]TDT61915.1 condensin subunit ScpA [Fonticella tunisiensis]
MGINIKLEIFEGPLDLLLHLIKKAEVDIYDIPIAEITDQYITYLRAMEDLDLEIASEFLIMAATLLEIKSRMLLPKAKTEGDKEASAEEDPREELVRKLVEYKKYKEFAYQLKSIEENNVIFFKSPDIIDDIDNSEVFFKNITLENLMVAFKKVIRAYENRYNDRGKIPENIDHDEFKIEDKMDEIRMLLKEKRRISFNRFFERASNKIEIIVIFLAMLELIKLKEINAIQYESFGDIIIEGQG